MISNSTSTTQVNVEEISSHFLEYLQQVEDGNTVLITKSGHPDCGNKTSDEKKVSAFWVMRR